MYRVRGVEYQVTVAGSSKRARLDLRRQSFMSDPEDEEDSLRLTLGPPGSSSSRLSSSQDLFLRTTSAALQQQQQGPVVQAVSTQSEEDEHYRPRRTPVRTLPPGALCSSQFPRPSHLISNRLLYV